MADDLELLAERFPTVAVAYLQRILTAVFEVTHASARLEGLRRMQVAQAHRVESSAPPRLTEADVRTYRASARDARDSGLLRVRIVRPRPAVLEYQQQREDQALRAVLQAAR